MATLNELLGEVSAIDKTLVISNDFRTINIPSSVPNLGVEYDDDVLRLDFKMPRYVSDTDLSTFHLRINYINSQGESDVYTVSDKKVYNNYITFSWLVGPTATRYKGNTKFIVCAKIANADGVVDREFNTTIATLPVLEGLEVDESVVTDYSDIIEQWRQELFGIGDTEEASIREVSEAEQAAIENKGAEVLATIPADYQTAVSMTDNADRTKADAIVCSACGDVIQVKDSSDDYLRGLKIFGKTTQITTTGKNLLDVEEHLRFTYIHGKEIYIPAGTYILTFESETHGGTYAPYVCFKDNNVGALVSTPGKQYPITLTTDETQLYIYANNYNASGSEGISATIDRLMLSVDGGEYEPYTGALVSPSPSWPQELTSVDSPTINIYNKNLWSIDHIELTGGSRNDVLFEGRVPLPVTMSWIQDFTRTTGSALFSYVVDGNTYFTASSETPGPFYHVINKGKYLEQITLVNWAPETGNLTNIQLELGSTATVYETYEPVQPVELPYSLPGIPVTLNGNYIDMNGQQWICDEIDFDRGIYVKRVGMLTLTGTGTWQNYSKGSVVHAFRKKVNDLWSAVNSYSAHNYSLWSNYFGYGGYISEKLSTGIGLSEAQYIYLRFDGVNDNITTIDELTAWLADKNTSGNPVVVKYPLATPIETPLTAEEIEWFRFAHTNYPNTTVLNDAGATMELKYNADTRLWVDNIPKVTDEQASPLVEAWMDEHFADAEGVVYGKSAYEIAVERGFQGSEEYWLASLKGRDGKDGKAGTDGITPVKGVDYFTQLDKDEIASLVTPVQIITWEDDD